MRFKVIIFHRVGRNDFGLTRIRLGEKATDHEKAFLFLKARKENAKITIMQMPNLNFKSKC